MKATYRCGHIKEFNDERFHRYQIGAILSSYATRDCPNCRQTNPTGGPKIDIMKIQSYAELKLRGKSEPQTRPETAQGIHHEE